MNIICLSNQLWDFDSWTNKKHVMVRLAKLGHKVLFVDPPINTGFLFIKHLQKGNWRLGRLVSQLKKEENGMVVYTPLNIVPFTIFTAFLHIRRLASLIRKLQKNSPGKTVLWVYNVELPHLKSYLEQLKYDVLVYDCVDNYEAFPRYDTPEKKKAVREIEQYLTGKATVVFATAPGLVEKLKKHNANVYFTPNVGDYERFKDSRAYKDSLPADLQSIPRPRIGFIGALDDYKFDADLVRKVAENHPNYSIVLIGPMALKEQKGDLDALGLAGLPNVYYLGPKPYEQKKYYLAGFDADMIPYRLNDYTVGGCFPVKFHDSLAAGLPVVVTAMPAYEPFRDVCYISKSYEEFSQNLDRALTEDSAQKVKERQQVAKENNWDGKVERMLSYL